MTEIPLSEFGLMTVAEAEAAYGWSAKAIQRWVTAGRLHAVVVGGGWRTYLLRVADLEAFSPPPRGRPKTHHRTASEVVT